MNTWGGIKMLKSAAVVTVLVLFSMQTATMQKQADYVHDRTAGEGKLWLSWTPDEREKFLFGYLKGYGAGFPSGCRRYFAANPPKVISGLSDSPLQSCMLQELSFSKKAADYESQITAFYKSFPVDADLPISWLVQAFSDSERKTPDEIHEAWSHGNAHP
jgi:hypothetical protein